MKRHTVKLLSLIMMLALCLAGFFASSVFSASAAEYSASNIFTTSVGASFDDSGDTVAYKMGAESSVSYRKNLALKWFTEDGAQYFSTSVSFGAALNFNEFGITLEAAQHTMNKEEKSTNTLTFKNDNGSLQAYVNDQTDENVSVPAADEYVVALAETAEGKPALDGTTGEYYVTINNLYVGTFTNIGSKYAEYKSSSITPLVYSVDSLIEGASEQVVSLNKLNNQALDLNESGKITDNAAPVFVLNNEIKVLELGATLSLDYKNIDVLDSSVSTEYYMFAYKGTNPEGVPGDKAEEGEDADNFYKKADSLTKVVFWDSDIQSDGYAYGSVAFKLSDGEKDAVYYLEDYVVTPQDFGGKKYVKFTKDINSRPAYYGDAGVYQEQVTAAAVKDGKSIQIGSGAYFYLPSLRSMIEDENCGYTELEFDVYYKNQTNGSGSATGLSYNELKFEIPIAGVYEFKVVASNKYGKAMLTAGGAEIDGSNVWKEDSIPSFTFTVENNGPTIEESEINDLGYIDVSFTFPSFKIVALSGYRTEYKLFKLNADTSSLSIEEVNANPENYEWTEIAEYDSEKDEDEGDNPYEWRGSSLSFIPQEKGFYRVTVTVVDSDGLRAESHQVVNVTSKVDTVRGETYWLKNNILSVVFMVIGGLCLIGIIVLLVIKPKETENVSDKKARKAALKAKRNERKK